MYSFNTCRFRNLLIRVNNIKIVIKNEISDEMINEGVDNWSIRSSVLYYYYSTVQLAPCMCDAFKSREKKIEENIHL